MLIHAFAIIAACCYAISLAIDGAMLLPLMVTLPRFRCHAAAILFLHFVITPLR